MPHLRRLLALACFVALGACEYQPLSEWSSLTDELPYLAKDQANGNKLLETRIAVPAEYLGSEKVLQGNSYALDTAPAGEKDGIWRRQNSIHSTTRWGESQQFWFGWWFLDLFELDRSRHLQPTGLEWSGIESLFSRFASDPATRILSKDSSLAWIAYQANPPSDSTFGLMLSATPEDSIVVSSLVAGAPAQAVLKVGDRLAWIDNRMASGALADWRQVGSRSSRVVFVRPGVPSPLDSSSLARKPVPAPSVFSDILPSGVGYIAIGQLNVAGNSAFGDAYHQFVAAAAKLLASNSRTWILDLRGNSGGNLDQARAIASSLVVSGSTPSILGRLRFRRWDPAIVGTRLVDTSIVDSSTATIPDLLAGAPLQLLQILQDGSTSGAAEFLVSALRDNLGASVKVYGSPSAGADLGQIQMATPDPDARLMIASIARILTARGASFGKSGIAPDVALQVPDSVVNRAWTYAANSSTGLSPAVLAAIDWNRREIRHGQRGSFLPGGWGLPRP